MDDRGDRLRSAPRTRARDVTETGSFGRSARRSRSRTGSLPPKREDATMQSADKIFSSYLASRKQTNTPNNGDDPSPPQQRKPSYLSSQPVSHPSPEDATSTIHASDHQRTPTEVILRGYASPSQQYAAINHYEQLAGRICEDYSREPPIEARRYKSDLRDPALTRRLPLSSAERHKVSRVAGGEHWVKVTFESVEAADAAFYASPQKIMGHLVYAEPYRNVPPMEDAAVLDAMGDVGMMEPPARSNSVRGPSKGRTSHLRRGSRSSTLPKSFSTPAFDRNTRLESQFDSPESQTSTQTMDSATVSLATSSATASTATVTGASIPQPAHENGAAITEQQRQKDDDIYCRKNPSARRVKLRPAEEALAPQPSLQQRLVAWIPLIAWFSGAMIGSEVPRNEVGDFDLNKASLYWRVMFYLDLWFGLWSKELASGADKDD